MTARARHVAIGDPQAPFEKFSAILEAHGLLGKNGRLLPDVHLVSMGDHFDWGNPSERVSAADSCEKLLGWLAAHPADQVTILLGNHDLCRVGELATFDDATFERARVEAEAAYFSKKRRGPRTEIEFRREYGVSSYEVVARDFGVFRTRQRDMVSTLLRARRFRIAYAAGADLLLSHAGVTIDELAAIGVPAAKMSDARHVESALESALGHALEHFRDGVPFAIPHLHDPGNEKREGVGMFYHRPSATGASDTTLGRRFSPKRLPIGLTQAIGHIRDKKSRKLLDDDSPPIEGKLRHMIVDESGAFTYAMGVPTGNARARKHLATMIFTDGGMRTADVADYELFDLATGLIARRA